MRTTIEAKLRLVALVTREDDKTLRESWAVSGAKGTYENYLGEALNAHAASFRSLRIKPEVSLFDESDEDDFFDDDCDKPRPKSLTLRYRLNDAEVRELLAVY